MMPTQKPPRISRHIRRRAGRFADDTQGVSLVEFAFMFPILLAILMMTISLSNMMIVDRKVTLASQAAADLIAQRQDVDEDAIRDVKTAVELMMQPFAANFDISVVHVPFHDTNGTPQMGSSAVWRATINTSNEITDTFATEYATGSKIVGPNEANEVDPPNADDAVGAMGLPGDAVIVLLMNYYYQSLWLNDITFFGATIPGTMTFSKINFARPRLIRQITSAQSVIAVDPPP